MPLEPLTGFVPPEEAGSAAHLFAGIPTIRILIYTDDAQLVTNNETDNFGIGLMRKLLKKHQPTFATFLMDDPFTLVHRGATTGPTAARKLTDPDLLPSGEFDQVWFFGIHLSNLTEPRPTGSKETRGGPQSELTPEEIAELRRWMATGGVLVTGDHSEAKFTKFTPPSLDEHLSLGRALGVGVPRAAQLRKWDGGPTNDFMTSFNTHEANNGLKLSTDDWLQSDEKPQRIILPRYDADGRPKEDGDFHNLFKDMRGHEIDVFPDHMHEGELPDPRTLALGTDWPVGAMPLVAAVGTDKRKPRFYNLVTVYNGHDGTPPAGRIVADSTWHHYFNENLVGFTDASENSVADLIGQYYGNLATWLSSSEKRRRMSEAMYWWLFNQQKVRDVPGGPPLAIGRVALGLLTRVAPACEINELLQAHTPESLRARFPMLNFPAGGSTLSAAPSQELVLGTVIDEYRRSAAAPPPADGLKSLATAGGAAPNVISEGLAKAFSIHVETLKKKEAEAQALKENFK